jgi:predicted transcriptional regulator
VLCMETIGKIRRRRLVDHDSISEIARDMGLSRNTVKKALRSDGEPPEYRREAPTPASARSVPAATRAMARGGVEAADARATHRTTAV